MRGAVPEVRLNLGPLLDAIDCAKIAARRDGVSRAVYADDRGVRVVLAGQMDPGCLIDIYEADGRSSGPLGDL